MEIYTRDLVKSGGGVIGAPVIAGTLRPHSANPRRGGKRRANM
jgi:hypothetical protein